ncbi:hypothetical protein TNCV_3310201 [Trichonephila clavipes]|nr:hypothetical protein TNCV_3310201 [Trichonephila clavipes]
MTKLGLKTLNVVPCYCHHNDVGDTEYHQLQHLPHHVAHHWLTHVLAETFLSTVLLYGSPGVAARITGYCVHENVWFMPNDAPAHFLIAVRRHNHVT